MENDICLFEHILTQNLLDVAFYTYALRVEVESLSEARREVAYAFLDDMCNAVKEITFTEENRNREIIFNCMIRNVDNLTQKFKVQLSLCEDIRDKLIVCLNTVKMTKG